jgi:hypothetical protein
VYHNTSKNAIQLTEFGNSVLKQGYLLFRGDDFDANIHVKIVHGNIGMFVDLFLVWGVPVLEFLVVVGLGFG